MIAERVPLINLLSIVIFLICLWQAGAILWPQWSGNPQSNGSDASFIAGLDRNDEEREETVQKRLTKKLAPEAYRETCRIEHNFEAVQNELRRDRPDWQRAARALSEIADRSDETIPIADRIRSLDLRLRNFDWRELQRLPKRCFSRSRAKSARLRNSTSDEQLQPRRVCDSQAWTSASSFSPDGVWGVTTKRGF